MAIMRCQRCDVTWKTLGDDPPTCHERWCGQPCAYLAGQEDAARVYKRTSPQHRQAEALEALVAWFAAYVGYVVSGSFTPPPDME